jgi:hypothetical protein
MRNVLRWVNVNSPPLGVEPSLSEDTSMSCTRIVSLVDKTNAVKTEQHSEEISNGEVI